MRLKSALILLLIATLTVLPMSVTGQEEPLPVVVPRAIPLEAPTVVLAVEPFHAPFQPTLLDAARANDYITFDALYREAKLRGESLGALETLHELWTYSVTDPIGAFYGAEIHDRLARTYSGFADYIAAFRIVDDHGAVFYPTSETRAFLIDRVVAGNAPRVLLADNEAAPLPPVAVREAPEVRASSTTPSTAPTRTSTRRTTSSAARVPAPTPVELPASATAEAPAPVAAVTETPAAAIAQPVTAVETPAVETPAVETPAVEAPAPQAATPAPALAEQPQPAAPVTSTRNLTSSNTSRGILLLVIGLIGVGLLALMLRAPKETLPVTVLPPQQPVAKAAEKTDAAKPPATVIEPIRDPLRDALKRPASSPQAQGETNRASGSRG